MGVRSTRGRSVNGPIFPATFGERLAPRPLSGSTRADVTGGKQVKRRRDWPSLLVAERSKLVCGDVDDDIGFLRFAWPKA
jgi:hypothetical protein